MLDLRFKLASGLGEPWTRDGGILSGLSIEYDVYCCSFICHGVGICLPRLVFSLSYMLII